MDKTTSSRKSQETLSKLPSIQAIKEKIRKLNEKKQEATERIGQYVKSDSKTASHEMTECHQKLDEEIQTLDKEIQELKDEAAEIVFEECMGQFLSEDQVDEGLIADDDQGPDLDSDDGCKLNLAHLFAGSLENLALPNNTTMDPWTEAPSRVSGDNLTLFDEESDAIDISNDILDEGNRSPIFTNTNTRLLKVFQAFQSMPSGDELAIERKLGTRRVPVVLNWKTTSDLPLNGFLLEELGQTFNLDDRTNQDFVTAVSKYRSILSKAFGTPAELELAKDPCYYLYIDYIPESNFKNGKWRISEEAQMEYLDLL